MPAVLPLSQRADIGDIANFFILKHFATVNRKGTDTDWWSYRLF
jgi:hypothetical protein